MTAKTSLFVARDASNNGTTPTGARLALGGLLAGNGASALDVRTGVLVDNGGVIVSGAADMTYNVRAFRAVTTAGASNGPTVGANDASVSVATTAAPGSNSRIDVIWCRQHLVTGDGATDTDVDFQIGVTQGTVSASPSAPAIPAGALSLAQVTVTSGTTATNTLTFTRTHPWTVANGGVIPVINSTERSAITPYAGCVIYYTPDKVLQYHDGTSWVPVGGVTSERIMVSSASQSIATNTQTLLNLWTNHAANTDTGTLFTHSAGTFTTVKTGRYQIMFSAMWDSASGSYRELDIVKNGTVVWVDSSPATSGANLSRTITRPLSLTAGDTVDFRVKHNVGTSLNIRGTTASEAAVVWFKYLGV